jgi:4-carboxymuconolactone decarboxylase
MANLTGRPITIELEALDSRQRAVYDAILAGPRGVVEGPLRIWLLSPDLAIKAQELGAFCRYRTSLPPVLSELAILVMGSFWRAGFEWHVHAPIAAEAGLDLRAIAAIRSGAPPVLEGAQLAVYRFAHALLATHEIDDATYDAALAAVGRQGVVELVGILGYYGLISMTIKAFRIPSPEGADDPFSRADTPEANNS